MHHDPFDFPHEPLIFWEAQEVFALCQQAEGSHPSRLIKNPLETHCDNPVPSLWLVKDTRVYLIPNTLGQSRALFAEKCCPEPENFEHIHSACGYDDFTVSFPCDDIRTLWAETVTDLRNAGIRPLRPSQSLFQVEFKSQTIKIGFCGK